MKQMWTDKGLQKCFERAREYQLSLSTNISSFCEHLHTITDAVTVSV